MGDVDTTLVELRDNAERLSLLTEQLRAIRAEETSPDGTVTVVVDGNGEPVDLRLSAAISRLSSREFGRTLVATAERAAGRAFAEHGALIGAFNAGEDMTSPVAVADRTTPEEGARWPM